MKKLIILFLASVCLSAAEAALRKLPDIRVAEGESLTFPAKGVTTIVSANTVVATVIPAESGTATVTGMRLGVTELTLSDAGGPFGTRTVTVVPTYWDMLQKFFEDDPEVTIGVVGGKVVISGQTANVDTLRKLEQARNFDPQRLVVQVTYAQEALGVLVGEYLDTIGVSNVSVKVMGRDVCLVGRMFDKQSINRVDTRVKEFLKDFPGVTVNSDGLRVYKQKILISIEFLSYDSGKAKNLGLLWPESIGGDFTGNAEYNWTSDDGAPKETLKTGGKVEVKGVKATVNLMKKNEVARKLYSTQLSTQSGEPAVFQSGGTIHKVQTSSMTSTTSKEIEYGFIIRTTPVIIDPNTVNLDFELDHKTPINLQNATSQTDLNVERYQTKSKYVVRPGESIVLSGFNKASDDETKNGFPLLSKIPWIGPLVFGNTSSSAKNTEMVLIVTIDWSFDDENKHSDAVRGKVMAKPLTVEMPW